MFPETVNMQMLIRAPICKIEKSAASFFVSISYVCWAYRRRRLTILGKNFEIS